MKERRTNGGMTNEWRNDERMAERRTDEGTNGRRPLRLCALLMRLLIRGILRLPGLEFKLI
ncbi:hypothetical protein [Paenibacillus sp. FSL M7-0420]|uniref:hypothetical protein n=1 Tax=Paenibacillus sp. FSL M7-0420 TaxID=2921609 RepID=UPI0030FB3661